MERDRHLIVSTLQSQLAVLELPLESVNHDKKVLASHNSQTADFVQALDQIMTNLATRADFS